MHYTSLNLLLKYIIRTLSVISLTPMPLDFDKQCSVNVDVRNGLSNCTNLNEKRALKNWYNIHSYGCQKFRPTELIGSSFL
jgi:hypothetical protein